LGSQPLMILFVIPLILSAYFGGMEAGLAATVMAALATTYFLLPPVHSFEIAGPGNRVQWAALWIIGIVVSLLVEALHRSRRRLETSRGLLTVTLGSIGDAVISTDREGRVKFLNAEAERLTGWTAQEALDQPLNSVFKIIDEQSGQPVESPVDKVLVLGMVVGLANSTVLITKDGREIPIDSSAAPMRQADGKVHGVVLVCRDVTERKRVEEVLREKEKEAQRLAKENGVMAEIGRIVSSTLNMGEVHEKLAGEIGKLLEFDNISFNIIDSERKYLELLYVSGVPIPGREAGVVVPLAGTITEEIVGTRSGIVIDDIEEKLRKFPVIKPIWEAGLRSMIYVPLYAKDEAIGSMCLISFKTKAYGAKDLSLAEKIGGQIAGAIANAKLYQKEKELEKELLKSEERYRLLVDLSPLMVLVHQQGKYIYANAAACKALGASKPEELIGRSIYGVIHPDCWDLVKERLIQAEQGKAVPLIGEKYIRLDNEVIDVEVNHTQILEQQERMVLIVARDITEQKKMESEKAVLQEQLQQAQKMEAIGTLVVGLPMISIIS